MLNMMMTYLKAYVKNEEGQGMVEYGLIIALIAVFLIVVLGTMSGSLQNIFNAIATALNTAATPPPATP